MQFFLEGLTMRKWTWTALAAGLLLTGVGATSADDIVRLGGPGVQNDIEGGTDTELIWGRYWGGGGRYYGGARYWGGGGRYYGGYYGARDGGGGYYGARHWGGGYYGAVYRPYYYGSYYRPYYRPAYYYTPSYYYQQSYNDCYYSPIMGDAAPTLTLQAKSTPTQRAVPSVPSDGSFPYDGGPRPTSPAPAPRGPDLNPSKSPQPPLPLEGRLVKLPAESSIGMSSVTSPEIQRLRYVTTPVRVSYPAYGEEPISPAPRKVTR